MNKDEMVFGLNSIITRHIEEFLEGEKFWKKRHDVAHKANLKLEEQNKTLTQEKQALLDVIADWSKAFEAAEERHEDFKKRSDGILATMGENLQRKQEQIEALTTWKTGTEKVLDSMEEKLRNYEVTSKAAAKSTTHFLFPMGCGNAEPAEGK